MDLPFEIWLYIISFLPLDQLQPLCTVNRAFYAVAMTEKCKVIDFGKDTRSIAGTLASLEHPSNAQRVRTLHLRPDVLAHYLVRRSTSGRGSKTKTSMLTRLYKHIGVSIPEQDRWNTKVMSQMLQIVGNTSSVTDFSMTTQGYFPRSQFRKQIVIAAWTAFGSNLRSLTLVAPLFESKFPLDPTLVFPNLDQLSIELSCQYGRVDGTKLVENLLVPFMNNHHSTLRSLALSLQIEGLASPLPLFSGIRHLPYLSKFIFCCQFPSAVRGPDTSALLHILTKHSNHLRELELMLSHWSTPEPHVWYTQASLHVALPRLEFLHVTLDFFSVSFRTAAYLRQFKNSLMTLKLTGRRLTYSETEQIINVFAGPDKLRVLHLEIDHLGPELFDLFSITLPSLDVLYLVFLWVSSAFYQTMERQLYSEWNLRHFTARPYLRIDPDILANWEATIRAALPHLQTFKFACDAH